ncbi:concanavalin A-like lectin/glucanase domain-containing protein [Dichomitus squalens]|uniref:Concanavalin A-like lectin/glucanase domain-containing protein n=1 Tax=Dichomitus squalens TaxID=114155 RepID=A0A4Q9MV15_9APHY|nr:concanavalin A-like lectin/glucanase domain-containing protein [Dichomitus squalens]
MRSAIPLASALFTAAPTLAAYNLIKEYQGSNFFSGWEFYGNYDNLTNGDVTYLDQANATASKLAYVNDAGNAIIKVDDTSFVPWNDKRNSIRIETYDYFPVGTVLLFDAVHLPYGCSVWPSFWTKGPNWPAGGEIDVLEGVNLMTANQMALHTSSGCTVDGTDCSSGAGCTVMEKKDSSYGQAFAAAGGGVWATQLDTTGINIWFWSRNDIPDSVKSATNTVDPTSWGTPSASYPSGSSCDISQFFTPQQLVLDISLCGDWAGLANVYGQTCGTQGQVNSTSCYLENVINNGNYSSAYFEISYIKAFSSQADTFVATVSGSSTGLVSQTATGTAATGGSTGSPTSGSNSNGNSTSTGSGSGNGAAETAPRVYLAIATCVLFSFFNWAMI